MRNKDLYYVLLSFSIVLLLIAAVRAWPQCDSPDPFPGIRRGTNCYYDIAINEGGFNPPGAYTAGTGPLHEVTLYRRQRESAVLNNGFALRPFGASLSIRSWSSDTDYLFDSDVVAVLDDGGFTCVPSRLLPPPVMQEIIRHGLVVGYIGTWTVQERGDWFAVTIKIEARGDSLENSVVEITSTVQNLAASNVVNIGLRYVWEVNAGGASNRYVALTPPDPPLEPFPDVESEWLNPEFDHFLVSRTRTPSTHDPLYFGVGSITGPFTLQPPPTRPDRFLITGTTAGLIIYEKQGPLNVCFDWHVPDPPRQVQSSGTGVAYFWGDREENAIALLPGTSTSVTQYVWAYRSQPVTCDAGGPYAAECEGAATPVLLGGEASHTLEGNPLLYRWSSPDPEVMFDDSQASKPVAFLPGPGVYPISLEVGIGPFTRSCTTEVEVADSTLPLVDAGFNPVNGNEDEDVDIDIDEDVDGVYAVFYSATDTCDSEVETEAYLDIYGNDETCDDEDPDFPGYPVNVGDLVRLKCTEKVACALPREEDEDSDIAVEISGPGMRLRVTGVDDSGNRAEAEQILVCPDRNGSHANTVPVRGRNSDRRAIGERFRRSR